MADDQMQSRKCFGVVRLRRNLAVVLGLPVRLVDLIRTRTDHESSEVPECVASTRAMANFRPQAWARSSSPGKS